MNDCITIFRQILQLLPKNKLAKSIEEHAADRYVKKFSTQQLLYTLVYAHISKKASLRDIETGMAMHQNKLLSVAFSLGKIQKKKGGDKTPLSI